MPNYIDSRYFAELSQKEPASLTCTEGVNYKDKEQVYTINIWGEKYIIDLRQKKVYPSNPLGTISHDYLDLFIVYYLLNYKETTLSNEWISEKDLPGGATFFRGPHLVQTQLISGSIGNDLELFEQRCIANGGVPIEMGDRAFSFEITPYIPIVVLYWQGDEDFPAEAKLLFDKSIGMLLPLDIIFGLAHYVCYKLGY